MRYYILTLLILIFTSKIFALEISADLFTYDEAEVENQFKDLNKLEAFIKSNPEILINENILSFPFILTNSGINKNLFCNPAEITAPGKIPSFLFTFIFSAIGTYTLYGAVAGPISVGIVYLSANKDRIETRKAIWGCVTGTLIGAGIKYAVYKLR